MLKSLPRGPTSLTSHISLHHGAHIFHLILELFQDINKQIEIYVVSWLLLLGRWGSLENFEQRREGIQIVLYWVWLLNSKVTHGK